MYLIPSPELLSYMNYYFWYVIIFFKCFKLVTCMNSCFSQPLRIFAKHFQVFQLPSKSIYISCFFKYILLHSCYIVCDALITSVYMCDPLVHVCTLYMYLWVKTNTESARAKSKIPFGYCGNSYAGLLFSGEEFFFHKNLYACKVQMSPT